MESQRKKRENSCLIYVCWKGRARFVYPLDMDGSNCLERAKKTDERVKTIELAFHLQVQVSLKVYTTLSLSSPFILFLERKGYGQVNDVANEVPFVCATR